MFSTAQINRAVFLDTTNRNSSTIYNLSNIAITLGAYHLEGGDIRW